ncbi:MAG: DHH family phosphoesterase [Candidatus Nanoarchaeia archaeon]|nr:DHH family phosphoesterase [Candidatus Nanoarchaeia archaeon]MDD5587996.1 DHH family phosphoesterase [Candidatus Nanoarchaeia archaeon]
MIPTSQLKEIKDYLVNAENPLIFFDDDPDGLCSYLLMKQLNDNAKGIVIKSSPVLDVQYLKKIEELSPDIVFVLDKPLISQEFIDNVHVPIIWVDHHPLVQRKGVNYYNPRIKDEKDNSPTTYLVYKALNNNLWIATVGSIADWYIPDFLPEFKKQFPGLLEDQKKPEDILFNSKLGTLVKLFSFNLKGKTSDVRKNIAILSKIETPYEILNQETSKGKLLYKNYTKINKAYEELLAKAIESMKYQKDKRILLFIYPSAKTSFTTELSNELLYKYPDRLIIIGREKGDEIKMSLRSSKLILPGIIEKALVNVKGYGGGHDYACGSSVAKEDFPIFIDNIKNQIGE